MTAACKGTIMHDGACLLRRQIIWCCGCGHQVPAAMTFQCVLGRPGMPPSQHPAQPLPPVPGSLRWQTFLPAAQDNQELLRPNVGCSGECLRVRVRLTGPVSLR